MALRAKLKLAVQWDSLEFVSKLLETALAQPSASSPSTSPASSPTPDLAQTAGGGLADDVQPAVAAALLQ
eukprot:3871159-Pleurochrysis_carterae.AAC.1